MVAVPCNDSVGNHRPRSGNCFFIVVSTMTSPVRSSVVVFAETCDRSAMAVAAFDGLSDVTADRTALRAMSFSHSVSRHTDNVASSNSAQSTTKGAINANSTVACPRLLRRGVRCTIKYVVKHGVKEGPNFSGSSASCGPCDDK